MFIFLAPRFVLPGLVDHQHIAALTCRGAKDTVLTFSAFLLMIRLRCSTDCLIEVFARALYHTGMNALLGIVTKPIEWYISSQSAL